jgi:hypothetical protein
VVSKLIVAAVMAVTSVQFPSGTAERVVDLSYQSCGPSDVLVSDLDGVKILARCNRDRTRLFVTVENVAPVEHGALIGFSVGFCGRPVLGAVAPEGWIASTEAEEFQHVAFDVDTSTNTSGIAPSHRLVGFEIELRTEWTRSRSAGALWQETALATATTHDCP